jgi:predicted membrane chloride channel (bestrophin family)
MGTDSSHRECLHVERKKKARRIAFFLAVSSFPTPCPVASFQHVSVQNRVRNQAVLSLPSTRIDYMHSKSDEDDGEADEETSSWLSWMRGGKPRGTNQIRMREAAELGGVPRSDRYMSKDWFHNTITLPNSAILRDIKSPVLACTSWAVFWSLLHHHLKFIHNNALAASHLYIPAAPHSLTMSALGLLLVFRTNSAYQRFSEGREIWERIINTSRDLYRYFMMYEQEITIDKRRRLQRLLAAFPYLLRHRIRPNLVMRRLDDDQYKRDPQNTILLYQDFGVSDLDEEAAKVAQTEEVTGQSRRKTRPLFWVDKRTLPWRLLNAEGALQKCARAQNRPLWVADRMAMELRTVPDSATFTNRERMTLLALVDKLSHCIGAAERIHQTVRKLTCGSGNCGVKSDAKVNLSLNLPCSPLAHDRSCL